MQLPGFIFLTISVFPFDLEPFLGKTAAEVAVSADGKFARSLPEKWLEVERKNLEEKILAADIVFLSALVPGKLAPIIVTEEDVYKRQSSECMSRCVPPAGTGRDLQDQALRQPSGPWREQG